MAFWYQSPVEIRPSMTGLGEASMMAHGYTMARLLASAGAVAALSLAGAGTVLAQDGDPGPRPQGPAQPVDERNVIVVIGNRTIVTTLRDVPVEQTYDEDAVASYGVSTVGEALDEIRRENADEEPSFLVNGRPVADLNDVANLPVEAVARIETLPRGSATRINGAAGQRAYNVVLRASVRSATLTLSREEASEGGWHNSRGEALLTYIKGQDRLNLTLRGASSTMLREAERRYVPRPETVPYAAYGNIQPASGIEIDPQLSLLAGQTVSVLALPGALGNPTLAALLPGANRLNPSDLARYRSLRGASRPLEFALAGNKELTSWLSLAVNGRLASTSGESLNGLPQARFLVPQTNGFTPFSRSVLLALNDPARPLRGKTDSTNQALSATLNASLGRWRASVTGRWERREQRYLSRFAGSLAAGQGTVADAVNPFDGTLASSIPIQLRKSRSSSENSQALAEAQGPLLRLWAGTLDARLGLSAARVEYRANDLAGGRLFERSDVTMRAGVTVPLTSSETGFLSRLGSTDLDVDLARTDLGRFGNLTRRSLALNWQPAAWLRLVASELRDERAIAPELLAAPEVSTPNVPFFDPLRGETVDVTTIFGGAAGLANEKVRTQSLALTATPLAAYRFQLDAEYARNVLRNQVGALPVPSATVLAAFPDRFVRDGTGTLVLVDNRSINFARQSSEQVRFGLRFTVPLTRPGPLQRAEAGRPARRTQPIKLQFNVSHTILLDSTAIIRRGLPVVDLLEGGAIGLGGGQVKYTSRASLAISRGSTGFRLEYARRGASRLVTGSLANPDLLRFSPLATLDVKAFADLQVLLPKAELLRGTRLSLAVDNVANRRQRVTNLAGETPQAYQPVRRDPVGRTMLIELRKVF